VKKKNNKLMYCFCVKSSNRFIRFTNNINFTESSVSGASIFSSKEKAIQRIANFMYNSWNFINDYEEGDLIKLKDLVVELVPVSFKGKYTHKLDTIDKHTKKYFYTCKLKKKKRFINFETKYSAYLCNSPEESHLFESLEELKTLLEEIGVEFAVYPSDRKDSLSAMRIHQDDIQIIAVEFKSTVYNSQHKFLEACNQEK